MSASHLLVVVTHIFGASQGPVVHTQLLESAVQCQVAKKAVIDDVDKATSTLPSTYRTTEGVNAFSRSMATAECHPLNAKADSKK